MVTRLARLATHHARATVIAAVALFAVSGIFGGGVAEHLVPGGFQDPGSESFEAAEILDEQFGAGSPDVVLVVTAESGTVDDPEVADAGQAVEAELAAAADVTGVVSYWSEGNAPPLRNEDGTRALIVGRIDAEDDNRRTEVIEELAPRLRSDGPVVSVGVGGFAELFREVGTTIEDDLLVAELIALPLTLVLLVLIFGSVTSAGLPVMIGGMSVVGTLLVLRLLTLVTDVSIFALNLTTVLGLGLAIDYSLFVVSRFREELRAGYEPSVAVTRTVQTAGRTVAFSALTVAASLCALLVFPLDFLRSFAYAGIAVSILAGLFSVLVLPAVLRLLGHRVNSLTLFRRSVSPPEVGFWHRMAHRVMRRPIPIATAVVALLLVLGSPFLGVNLTLPDDRVLPESAQSRQVGDIIRDEFSAQETGALSVVAPSFPEDEGALDDYASRLARLPNVARVDAATGTYCGAGLAGQLGCDPGQLVLGPESAARYEGFTRDGGTYLSVVPSIEPMSSGAETLVDDVRTEPSPASTLVTGSPAELSDTNESLFARLPLALGIIAVITVVLLFMMFGSVVIPLKAVVLNLLSLSAMFGSMVWVFQDGNLSGLLDFTATGGLNTAMPILMFCIAFGLSMDYEVFLLSRIKEEHDRGAENQASVATGLQRTGRIVTAAALLMSVIFMSFAATASVSFIKMMGVGLTLAVLLDAFVIRGTLVPAFMRLAGRWNWWAPRPLRAVHDRWGISEHVALDASSGGETDVTVRENGGSGDRSGPSHDEHQPVT